MIMIFILEFTTTIVMASENNKNAMCAKEKMRRDATSWALCGVSQRFFY
jgi:hypothetical protein